MADDERVGYASPPKHSRFKKGQSGNRQGRKPKTRSLGKLLEAELDQMIEVREGGRIRRISKREVLITALVNDAIKGKAGARQLMLQLEKSTPPTEPFVPDEWADELLNEWAERVRQQTSGVNVEAESASDEGD